MTTIDRATETRPPAIRIVIDECAELFNGDRKTTDEFDRAVADVLAILGTRKQHPNSNQER